MIDVILINCLFGVIVMIFGITKHKKEVFCAGLIITLIPGIGILYVILCLLSWYLSGRKTVDGKRITESLRPDEKQVIMENVEEIVPISEALILNNTKIKKEILIKILREDKTKYIEELKEVLKDEDVEASHYAAVALVDIKDYFSKAIEKSSNWKNESIEELEDYELVLERGISSGLFNQSQEARLKKDHITVLKKMVKLHDVKACYFDKLVQYMIDDEKNEEAYKYCVLFKEKFPNDEMAYFCMINYYYQQKNKEKLDMEVQKLINGDVVLSRDGLKNIRFWIGDNNE